jgi:hypothetical protein
MIIASDDHQQCLPNYLIFHKLAIAVFLLTVEECSGGDTRQLQSAKLEFAQRTTPHHKKENTLADNPESGMPEIFRGPKFQEPRDPFGVYIVYSIVFEKMIICNLY